jgi:pterin-4a-carbinolamine dehydratase
MSSILKLISNQALQRGSKSLIPEGFDRILGTLAESTLPTGLPIEVEASKWETLSEPERLIRVFSFSDFESLEYFLNELLSYQELTSHHADITISHRQVQVSTYTHEVDQVTEIDLKLAEFCDEIYDDIYHINLARQRQHERSINDFG